MIIKRDYKIELLAIFIALIAIFLPVITNDEGDKYYFLFRYLDEILAVSGVIYIAVNFNKLNKNVLIIIFLLFALTIVGLLGTFINRLQTGLFPIIIDILAFWKVFLTFILSDAIVGRLSERSKKKVVKTINIILVPWMLLAFILAIGNLFADIGFSDARRFGYRCFMFFYPKSSTFSNIFYIIILFITLNYHYNKTRTNFIILAMSLTVWFLTLRSRAVLFVFIFIGMFYWLVYRGKRLKYKLTSIMILLCFSLFVVGEKIEDTFSDDAAPRTILLTYGIKTMMTYMPIGAGFGTYGTDVACTYYSKLYRRYGFEYAYGLNPNDTQYAHDTYWPAVMGEMGFVGVLIMAGVVFFWTRVILKYSASKLKYMLCLFLVMTQIMASLPTSIFFQNYTAFLFFLLPLLKDSQISLLKKQMQ